MAAATAWPWGAAAAATGTALSAPPEPAAAAAAVPWVGSDVPASASGSIVPPLVSGTLPLLHSPRGVPPGGAGGGDAGGAGAMGMAEDDEGILVSLLHELCEQ